jgi:hypothetical protein
LVTSTTGSWSAVTVMASETCACGSVKFTPGAVPSRMRTALAVDVA